VGTLVDTMKNWNRRQVLKNGAWAAGADEGVRPYTILLGETFVE